MIRKGDIGPEVAECQDLLNEAGANPALSVDGIFGVGTERATKEFQTSEGLIADGIIGNMTYNALLSAFNPAPPDDLPDWIHKDHMKAGQYIAQKTKKVGICLHHTVSNGNPHTVVYTWENDNRGTVGTEYIVGRKLDNGATDYDGKVVQAFPQGYWAHHILTTRMGFSSSHNNITNASYVGIELCSWGCLEKKNGKFYTLGGAIEIPAEEVCILDRPFRTFKYWHKYTKAQIDNLERLILWIAEREGIDIKDRSVEPPVVNSQWFEMDWWAMQVGMGYGAGRKLTSHTSFEYGKFDVFPQPELIEMIQRVCGYDLK